MKHLKNYKLFESSQDLSKFKCVDGGPNNNDGGVQVDTVIVEVNEEEYTFEVATTISGDIYVTFNDGEESEFTQAFDLQPGKRLPESELKDFLSVDGPNCEGDETEIDGFEINITFFDHEGGYEFGYLDVEVEGDTFQLEMMQDATGVGLYSQVTYSSEEDEEIGKKHGLNLESDDAQDYFFRQYDRISSEKRL